MENLIVQPESNEVTQATGELNLHSDQLLIMAEQAERRVAAIQTIMKAAIKITTHLDWVNIGGNPYLQETGASKIGRLMGISWQIGQPLKAYDEDKSGHYTYRANGKFFFAGAEIDAYGLRTTHDEFFIGKAGNPEKPQKKPQDVNERDVMQAAYTNCLNNGIKRIVPGLRNITMDYLKEAGIDTSQMKGYDFNSAAPKTMSGEALDQKAEIERMLKEEFGDNWTNALEQYTSFTNKSGEQIKGKKDINKISEKAMPVTYNKVKKLYDEWRASGGQPINSTGSASSVSGEGADLPL